MTNRNSGKNTRAPIGEQSDVNKMTDKEKMRVAITHLKRLDADHYLRMPEYKDKVLFWANSDGDVDKWISLGASPVPRKTKSGKVYKGINDRVDSEYEMVPAVSVTENGNQIDAFLLVMEPEDYHKYRIAPKELRNEEIRKAMGIGKVDEDARVMPTVKGLRSYAPNVGDGKTGLSTFRGGEMTHDV